MVIFFGGSHADDLLPDYVTDKTFFTFYLSYTRYYRCVM
ncbi:PTS system, maltose and glucose-specific IIC component / PTS system, maltose and glucose-specific IIB component [Escherichia coli ISC41]|nr:PTS system, maltose and glucose-specific IIC component / PTS system, maltose and glucose-specific IIB component [Escherichia coli ISC41]